MSFCGCKGTTFLEKNIKISTKFRSKLAQLEIIM